MIKASNISYSFPYKDLYRDVSFSIELGQHCAFIGSSGSGKSTLVDILLNPDKHLFDGKLEIDPACKIGYVSQFAPHSDKAVTVFEYVASEFLRLEAEIAALCAEMGTSENLEEVLEAYQAALDAFEAIGGDSYESLIDRSLGLAGLSAQKNLNISELSGGEFKLIQVIREMLHRPDLLIMDEPDVFLDFENLNGLRSLINAYKGSLLVITHNRFLLNHCFNKVLHLENAELAEYDGRYMDYTVTLLQTKIELQELSVKDEEEIERNQVLIDRLRFIATHDAQAARGKSLKARVRHQERLEARKTKAPFVEISQPDIRFKGLPLDNDGMRLEVQGYQAAFDDVLLENVDFEIKPTDKVALIGPNGTGKSTLLRDIFENRHPSIRLSEDTSLAYLSQKQGETLNESGTVQDELIASGFTSYREIRSYLAKFGFGSDALEQKVSSLSGGERNLLQLAKISAKETNLLLLDEPTSHLDTYAQIALEEALNSYSGAVLMVSHDYYTIVNCMDYVLVIEDKGIRKIRMRKFRQMIYKEHFDLRYLELEQERQGLETEIALALEAYDFENAKAVADKLVALMASA